MSAPVTPHWEIRLFGGLEARRGEAVVSHFRTRKTAALLAFLAYHAETAHPRDRLVELLWPDQPVDAGRNSLSTALWTLRKLLDGAGDEPVLQTDRDTLRVASDRVRTDVADFEALLERAARAGPDEARILDEALRLYRGELLLGHFEPWVAVEQHRLAERFFLGVRRLADRRQAEGDLDGALATARRAVSADPLREEAHCLVMRLHLAAGQPVEVVRQYRELERLLLGELEVRPGPEAQGFLRQAQASVALPALAPPPAEPAGEEEVGGAVPLGSPFYVARPEDALQAEAIRRGECVILLRGPRQVGKTSLLARGLALAREAGARVALTDVAALGPARRDARDFLQEVTAGLAEQLALPDPAPWSDARGPISAFERAVRREVLGALPGRLVWGLDNGDALFGTPYGSEVFALLRSWHNARALEPDGPWSRLTLLISYATEAHLFIADLEQSPFNVGSRIDLGDFTPDQVEELNARHRAPLDGAALGRFRGLVGGHPYLVRRGLLALRRGQTPAQLEAAAGRDGGPFAGHLRRLEQSLRRDPTLCEAVCSLLHRRPLTPESFYRLRSAGVVAGEHEGDAEFRCPLYASYLRSRMI
jgi:DNA-binding SARP family transcriptional activator